MMTMATTPLHPYYPLDAELIGYQANDRHFLTLIGLFAGICLSVFGVTVGFCRRVRPGIGWGEVGVVTWFVVCGCIHLGFEGYYVYNFRTLASHQTIFGQLWKEYAHSDSRYLIQDPFVLCMETITAVAWGPLSFLTAYLILTSHPLRHPLQIIVSLGQMYGDILYYGTSFFDHHVANISYCRPEALYFYVYFVGMNAPWILVPGALIWRSMSYIGKAVGRMQEAEMEEKKKI